MKRVLVLRTRKKQLKCPRQKIREKGLKNLTPIRYFEEKRGGEKQWVISLKSLCKWMA